MSNRQTIKPVKEIQGLNQQERKLLSAWRATVEQHMRNSNNSDRRLMMYVELVPVGSRGGGILRCHHILRHVICGEPVN